MPTCPLCEHSWKNKAKICPDKIASTSSKRMKRRYFTYRENTLSYIDSIKEGDKFSTSKIINFHNVNGHTEGDVYRIVCDALVCRGVLSKTKFSTKGHTYMKNKMIRPCEYCEEGVDKKGIKQIACSYDWKQAKEIEVEEVK